MHTDAVTRHMTIPNQLTILRILLVPVIGAFQVRSFKDPPAMLGHLHSRNRQCDATFGVNLTERLRAELIHQCRT